MLECGSSEPGDGARVRERSLVSPGIGHNDGPPLDQGVDWRRFCWKKAHAEAWQTPPREVVLARLARAQALGMTYRQYTAVLLDKGVHL